MALNSNASPFFGEFFQFGYVARDQDQAIAQFQRRFGRTEFLRLPIALPEDGSPAAITGIALAYIGAAMVEIIGVNPSVPSIYASLVPEAPADLRLHHLGYLVEDHPAMLKRLTAAGYEIPIAGSMGDVLDYAYADTRAHLGHYCECIRLGEAGKALFASVPRN
jgi:hypothetical protein